MVVNDIPIVGDQHQPRNGWKTWLLGAFFTIIMALGAILAQGNARQIEEARQENRLNAARLAVLEGWAKDHEGVSRTRNQDIERRLDAIQKTLDRLIDDRRSPRRTDR